MLQDTQFIGWLFLKALLFSAIILSPLLCMLAYRTWAGNLQQNLSRTRSTLGLASLAITMLNWLAFMLVILPAGHRVPIWTPISFVSATIALILALAFKKSARVYAVAADAPWMAIWSLQLFIFVSAIKQ